MPSCPARSVAWLVPGVAVMASLLLWAGYEVGAEHTRQQLNDALVADLHQAIDQERASLQAIHAEQRHHLDALALRMGQMQARMMRVDALGDRLVAIGKLDQDEFDFATAPAVGGLLDSNGVSPNLQEMGADFQRLNALLSDREDKLLLLEEQLLGSQLREEILPSGKPVLKGWISSQYGRRTDPFSGKKTYHRGLDFAGKEGTEVLAVASGVVKRAKQQPGYGNLVEIRHPDGYSTLYAHNQENLVQAGDVVHKGQVIALLGSTGRSSGPHVHFEVHKDGKSLDPLRYIRAP